MRKSLPSRILGLIALYFAVFVVLVIFQFSKKGNFTLPIGTMTIRGQYQQSSELITEPDRQYLTDGVIIFYGGLEFILKDNGKKGLGITDTDGLFVPVNPLYMILSEDSALFGLPGGTTLDLKTFNTQRGHELQIRAEFAQNVSEVTVPISPRRSSLLRDSGQLIISFDGDHYVFNRSNRELEDGKLVFSTENIIASYRSLGKQNVFDPSYYTIAQSRNLRDYEAALDQWLGYSFNYWSQNTSEISNEDDVIAYLCESLRRGNYTRAVTSIPRSFLNSSRRTYRSSVFLGDMPTAYRAFNTWERERTGAITRLINERSMDILKDGHIIDFLHQRNNTSLANDTAELIRNMDSETLNPDYFPGLLEAWSDFKRWRMAGENPVEQFIEQVLLFVSENIHRDDEKGIVYILHNEEINPQFNLRMGKALSDWAQAAENNDWAEVGRSLVLSVLTRENIGAGEFYRILNPDYYYPKAATLPINGLLAWTVSPSVNAVYQDVDMNITVSFPENMTHYMMIRGIRSFTRLQIHDIDFRSDSQFERYDSSGWIYYPQEQTLVLKLKHRVATETVRIIYRAERPPPPPPPAPVVERVVEPVREEPGDYAFDLW
jgi:hypothetical protein